MRASNIVTKLPGLIGNARNTKPKKPVEAWRCLIDENIIENIVQHTNDKITYMSSNYGPKALECQFTDHVDVVEMEALLGLLYLSGVFKSNHEDVESLFATDGTGRDIFRSVMSLKRFLFLITALRFDDAQTREERKKDDDLAPISEVFSSFIENCKINYSCGEYVTVDEMLVPFRGRCKFRLYMKSKPAKYGLKIMCLTDSRTHYLYNAYVYTGKKSTPNPNQLLVPTASVLHLAEPIFKTNRNVTGDNWFTSIQLATHLASENLTYVGTIKKNKRETPPAFKPKRSRQEYSSIFGFTRDMTLVSYVPKRGTCVNLLSTMHHDKVVSEDAQKKPEIIQFYNSTKSGVDSLDQKCANYSVGRRSKRWPLVIWYALMNIGGVNAHIIRNAADPQFTLERRQFLIQLGMELIRPQLLRRAQMTNLPRDLRKLVCKFAGTNFVEPPQPQQALKRRRCFFCPGDNKYSSCCVKCSKTVCKQHSTTTTTIVCRECTD